MDNVVSIQQTDAAKDAPPTFDDFWLLYPKRVAKLDAEKAWRQMTPQFRMDALAALVSWRSVWLADGRLSFVPHAATWLRGQRWNDEPPDSWGQSHASHRAADIPPQGERVAMPAKVREALARLRRG